MDKLLHERLREHSDDSAHFTCADGRIVNISRKGAQRIADEIERFYIPRPRFEDGEPVQFGDEIEDDGEWRGVVREIAFCDDGTIILLDETPETICETKQGYPVTRYAPKVLDADGVEIKVGDTVYLANARKNNYYDDSICCEYAGEMTVVEFNECREGYVICETPSGKRIDSPNDWLTHDKPVFDAEGERIKNGDVVWDVDSGEKLTVQEFANRECGLVQCRNEETWNCEDYDAHGLTHKEPDSLRKLRDDMVKFRYNTHFASLDTEKPFSGFIDRLTALMERGA